MEYVGLLIFRLEEFTERQRETRLPPDLWDSATNCHGFWLNCAATSQTQSRPCSRVGSFVYISDVVPEG